jgi:hypothetical protein
MSLSTCSRCLCRKSWDSTRYSSCEDCRRRRNLGRTASSAFPISSSIKNFSIRRTQVPICSAFSLTDYKVQSQTLTEAVLDLKEDSTIKGQTAHYKFCSKYVQLSRLKSSRRLHLLRSIQMSDVNFQPHTGLLSEMERLQTLETQTLSAWKYT